MRLTFYIRIHPISEREAEMHKAAVYVLCTLGTKKKVSVCLCGGGGVCV